MRGKKARQAFSKYTEAIKEEKEKEIKWLQEKRKFKANAIQDFYALGQSQVHKRPITTPTPFKLTDTPKKKVIMTEKNLAGSYTFKASPMPSFKHPYIFYSLYRKNTPNYYNC